MGVRGWVGVGLGWFQRGFAGEETKKNANVETDSAKKSRRN